MVGMEIEISVSNVKNSYHCSSRKYSFVGSPVNVTITTK